MQTTEAPVLLPVYRRRAANGRKTLVLGGLVGVLLVVCFFSITLGSRDITLATIWDAFADFDPASASQTVVREMRVPRTLLGLGAGAALGISGAILQGITRNPLADPGILGINAGAAAFVVGGIMLFGTQQLAAYIWLAFLGAGFATVVVYGVASLGREGATPIKLALAGAAITAGLTSVTSAIVMVDVDAFNELRTWQVGSLAGRYMDVFGRRRRSSPSAWSRLRCSPARRSTGWRSGRTSPARSASGSALTRALLFALVVDALRRGDRGLRADRLPRPRRAARGAALSAGPTTAGSCPTRSCWPRSSCCSPTSSDASCSRPASCRSASCSACSARPSSSPSSATAIWRSCEPAVLGPAPRRPQRAAPSPPTARRGAGARLR